MEKKNTGLIVLVVILSLLVVGLGGFIVYNEVLSDKNNVIDDVNEKDDDVENDFNKDEVLNSLIGVWGYRENGNYAINIYKSDNGLYYYKQGLYQTDGGNSGVITNVSKTSDTVYKFDVFSQGCKGYDCLEEKEDEILTFTLDLKDIKDKKIYDIHDNVSNKYIYIGTDFDSKDVEDYFS